MQRLLAALAIALLALAGTALAASPLLKPEKAFQTPRSKHGKLSLTLVSSNDGKGIEEGQAALGSQFALSGGLVRCPKAKRAPGIHESPFALFGFPRTKLKLSHGAYGFSTRIVQRHESIVGSVAKPFTLKLKIVGQVVSPTTIKGTLSASGGKCTIRKPLPYTAKLNPQDPVAPTT